MRICIPTQNYDGENSIVHGHFGSAVYFIIYDTETKKLEVLDNTDREHQHGMCNSIPVIKKMGADHVIISGIGPRAIQNLNNNGIKVLKVNEEKTVKEIIDHFNKGSLREASLDEACNEHQCEH